MKYVDEKGQIFPRFISEFCEKEDTDEEERKISILADCIEDYKFMNYNDWKTVYSIIIMNVIITKSINFLHYFFFLPLYLPS